MYNVAVASDTNIYKNNTSVYNISEKGITYNSTILFDENETEKEIKVARRQGAQ